MDLSRKISYPGNSRGDPDFGISNEGQDARVLGALSPDAQRLKPDSSQYFPEHSRVFFVTAQPAFGFSEHTQGRAAKNSALLRTGACRPSASTGTRNGQGGVRVGHYRP